MKCPACWSEKAYLRDAEGWKARLLSICGVAAPMRCHHCYHRFWVPWILAWGKQVRPRKKKMPTETPPRLSYAAKYLAEQQDPHAASDTPQDAERGRRAAA